METIKVMWMEILKKMTEGDKMIEMKHGIIAIDVNTGKMAHFVGFADLPELATWVALHKELKADNEFGLTGVDFVLAPAPQWVMDDVNEKTKSGEYNIVFHEGDNEVMHPKPKG